MAEKKKEHEDGKKPAKKHLHEIRSERTEDGHILHHHTYLAKKGDTNSKEPERKNVAVSSSPEEAGEHVSDQMGMAQGGGDPSDQSGQEPGGETAPEGGAPGGGAGAPEEMMG